VSEPDAGEARASERGAAVERAVAIASADPSRLLCVVGPTASGKTDLAIAVCERVGGEVISADSVQIYRGFDVGSGKPSAEERARAPHHVIDLLDPMDPCDAVTFTAHADRAIADVRARGKVPVLCGGTYFWVRALVLGLAPAPPADAVARARHREIVDQRGRQALHDALRAVDPASADRLHPNDVVRVSRALEVHEVSGRPMSAWHADHGFRDQRLPTTMVGLATTPEELTERIARRVDTWLAQGWIEEVEGLIASGAGGSRPMGSVGYDEVRAYLAGSLPRSELRDAIVRATRTFARRQRTWLKSADVTWL